MFKNQATQKFYEFFRAQVEAKELTHEQLAAAFKKYEANPPAFLHNFKKGIAQVTVEQIEIARDVFGLPPGMLFTTYKEGDALSIVHEPAQVYTAKVSKGDSEVVSSLGSIFRELLRKHEINIDQYCREHLHISRQLFYQMVKGQVRLPLDIVVTTCDDLGESLDIFRSKPLPKGHMMTRIKELEAENELLKKQIKP